MATLAKHRFQSSFDQESISGEAVACILSASFGLFVLAALAVATDLSPELSRSVYAIGKLWIPLAEGIGPYSGKETLSLVAWLTSWPLIHFILRGKSLSGRFWLMAFLVIIGIASTLIWPPVWHVFKP